MDHPYSTCLEKQKIVQALFAGCIDQDSKYQKIIELGKHQPPLDSRYKIPENKVEGCQSTVYLRSYKEKDLIYFEAEADALISAGLIALLIKVYSGETAEAILKCPPTFINELGLAESLTPNRASGLYSMHLRIKQDALKLMISDKTG